MKYLKFAKKWTKWKNGFIF